MNHPVLSYFEQLSRVPRGSFDEARVSAWVRDWAATRGYTWKQDHLGNLVVNVPASSGHSTSAGVVVQAHLDMVCEKTSDSPHDFKTDPIRLVYDGEWLRADNTTLGADNGIGVAMLMAAAGEEVQHPPLELLFTVQEEVGIGGASQLTPDFISYRRMINLDSEEEGVFVAGCAGGRQTFLRLPLSLKPLLIGWEVRCLEAGGLFGGHSGLDIGKHRGNANQLVARALRRLSQISTLRLARLQGGSAMNAIPRSCSAHIAAPVEDWPALSKALHEFEQIMQNEFAATEPELFLRLESSAVPINEVVTEAATQQSIRLLMALPNGVAATSARLAGMVETSNNLARVELKDGVLVVSSSQRSNVMSRLEGLTGKLEAIGQLAGAQVEHNAGYPAWEPVLDSTLLQQAKQTYQKLFGVAPRIEVLHAGLECGILGALYPGMDMLSTGPTLKDPHSPSERVHLPSIERTWDFVKALLAGL